LAFVQVLTTNTERRRHMRLFSERAALREGVARLLDELGDTAGEVAASLRSQGVPLGPSSGGDSPTARYLHAVVGADAQVKRVRVTKRWLVLKTRPRLWPTIRLRLPHPVTEFTISVNEATRDEATEVPYEGNQT
jgi:hypothetical protein